MIGQRGQILVLVCFFIFLLACTLVSVYTIALFLAEEDQIVEIEKPVYYSVDRECPRATTTCPVCEPEIREYEYPVYINSDCPESECNDLEAAFNDYKAQVDQQIKHLDHALLECYQQQ